jgi:hypothetical protein
LTQDIQTKILEIEKPDLVILTGDCISGYAWNGKFYLLERVSDKNAL